MNTTDNPQREPSGGSRGFFDSIRDSRIVRSDRAWLGGVASGLAERIGIDPILMRGIVVVLSIFTGIGPLLYGLGWAFLPDRNGYIHAEALRFGRWHAGMTGATIVTVIGLFNLQVGVFSFGNWGVTSWSGSLVILGLIGVGIYLLVRRTSGPAQGGRAAGGQGGAPFAPAGDSGPAGDGGPVGDSGAGGSGGSGGSGATWTPGAYPGAPGGYFAAPPAAGAPDAQPAGSASTATSAASATSATAANAYPAASAYTATSAYPTVPGAAPTTVPATGATDYAAAWSADQAARPARPVRPRVLGPGPVTGLVTTGLALLAGTAIYGAHYLGLLPMIDSPLLLALGVAAGIFALGVLISGIRGRHGGFLGWLASFALIATLITPLSGQNANWAAATAATFIPNTMQEASEGYTVVAGSGRIDLTGLSPTESAPAATVHVDVAMGSITVIVPRDVRVSVDASQVLGNVKIDTSAFQQGRSGVWFSSTAGFGPDDDYFPRITLVLRGAMSNATITDNKGAH
ncbi:PspC domain-containing protein [Mycetocola tolaasinivorans]|uniref:PspC domain-containing protein n=1 Tax=Mycetocola tolaasinivorans TaxID=76635 RepID=A0A3L7A353_9MICO|nr:PspC domain-containing protein [Mycetocola tolaasinivorans]RLP74756.1 PspC domain-containing protein [Mycetocola tolaasinivorans]